MIVARDFANRFLELFIPLSSPLLPLPSTVNDSWNLVTRVETRVFLRQTRSLSSFFFEDRSHCVSFSDLIGTDN